MKKKRIRGSIWKNPKFKTEFLGSYKKMGDRDRCFVLTNLKTQKTLVYESPERAKEKNWVIVKHGQ